jgi:hypothetical protein
MNFAERTMVALASATYSGSSITWQLGTDGEPNGIFRIRWESASEGGMVVRGFAEAFGDDVPWAVAGKIAVECNVSDRDGVVMMGELRILADRPEWLGAVGGAIVLANLGQTPLDNIFEEAN